MHKAFKFYSTFFFFLFQFLLSNGYTLNASTNRSDSSNRVSRVVALTSLSADLVNYISNESLLGIPGSSLLKNNNDF